MFKVGLGLFIGFGPLFILCPLFDQTKSLFQRWLFYGIATLFSLSVLVVMVEIATRAVGVVAAKFWLQNWASKVFDFSSGSTEGISSMALQQGGLGLVLTGLIVTVPPMAGLFFNGMMGSFMHYSVFGGNTALAPSASGPAGAPSAPGRSGQQPTSDEGRGMGDFASRTPTHGDRTPNTPA